MNAALLKMIGAMVGPEQIAEMLDSLTRKLIEYKNSFPLQDDEDEMILILFEDEKQIAATVAALTPGNQIKRQVKTVFVKDLFVELFKNKKDA